MRADSIFETFGSEFSLGVILSLRGFSNTPRSGKVTDVAQYSHPPSHSLG